MSHKSALQITGMENSYNTVEENKTILLAGRANVDSRCSFQGGIYGCVLSLPGEFLVLPQGAWESVWEREA